MENKTYSVNITQKDHLSFIIHELRFHALLVSIIAFLGFGAYSVFFVLNASPKFNTITVLNIITNLAIVLAAVAAANVLLYFLCNYFATQRAQREAGSRQRRGQGKHGIEREAIEFVK